MMLRFTNCVLLFTAAMLTGCAISLTPYDPGDAAVPDAIRPADVATHDTLPPDAAIPCRSTADCPTGAICEGLPGCDTVWTCVQHRLCSEVESVWCDCSGQTFTTPDSCPGRVYAHAGACEMPPPPPDAGTCAPNGNPCNHANECCSGYCMPRGAPMGACETPPAGTFPCGDNLLCQIGMEYCELTFSDVPTPDSVNCEPIPAGCNGAVNCSCITHRPCTLRCMQPDSRTISLQCPGG